jgi:hypothetical protein
MARPLSAAIPLAFSLLCFSPALGDSDDSAVWLETLDEATYAAAGLEKLSDQELSVLSRLLIRPGGPSFLDQEAAAYLERNDWQPVEVTAVLGGKRQIVVLGDDGPTRLEAWSSIEPLPPPGVHWAKHRGSWDVLNPDGTSQHYSE